MKLMFPSYVIFYDSCFLAQNVRPFLVDRLWNFGAYRLEFSSSIRQLVGLGGLFCQLNVTEQGGLVTTI